MTSTRPARSAAASSVRRRRGSRFGYSPALDGVRGISMVTFMAFHFGFTWLQGAWVAVNVFFVLSAFLITRLLVEERVDWGRIDVLGFYRRRARRLLPALFLLLGTLCAYGLILAPGTDRRALRNDILATFFYVQNWHLIATDDQYFQTFDPSFLRHAWTLAVEEQFYLIVPLLVGALMLARCRRRAGVAVLLVLGLVSAGWTAHVGVATRAAQSHAYYGTDTRAQALCIGAALGLTLAPTTGGRLPRPAPRWAVAVLGWLGLGSMVYAYLAVAPFTTWMFDDGGLYLFAVGSAALVYACADPRWSPLNAILGWRPFAYLGRLSYSLYLWHWPIHLWLDRILVGYPRLVTFGIGFVITTAIAAASYRWLERPVIRGGLPALAARIRSGRVVVASAAVAILLAAYGVGDVSAGVLARSGSTTPLVAGVSGYQPQRRHVRIAVFGDSVPYLLVHRMPKDEYPDLTMADFAAPGCDLLLGSSVQWSPSWITAPDSRCITSHTALAKRISAQHTQVLTVFAGPTWAMPHRLTDGQVVSLADPRYRTMVTSALTTLLHRARRAGVEQLQLVNLPCRSTDPNVFFIPAATRVYLSEHPRITRRVTHPHQLNGLLSRWAGRHHVPVIDLDRQLCPAGVYRPSIHGVTLYQDGLHFTPAASRMIWTWLAPQIRSDYDASVRQPVRASTR